MRVVIVYRDESDHAREVYSYMRDFERQTGKAIETIDPDTPEGAHFCRTYDVVEYPSVLAVADGGGLHQFWRGTPLPTISEVSYYA